MTNTVKTMICAALLMVSTTAAQAITYTFDRAVGEGNVSGFITTDGTIGEIGEDNIVDFTIDWRHPGSLNPTITETVATQSFGFNGTNNGIYFTGLADHHFTATAEFLFFDFSSAASIVLFTDPTESTWSLWGANAFRTFPTGAFGTLGREVVGTIQSPANNQLPHQAVDYFALRPIATAQAVVIPTDPPAAVPLPAGLPLIALGLGALGLIGRKRRT